MSAPTLRDVKLARGKQSDLTDRLKRATDRVVEIQGEMEELGKRIGELRVRELIDPSILSEQPELIAQSQVLQSERAELQQTVSDIQRTLKELGNEADRRASEFRRHSRQTLAAEMGQSIDVQLEQLGEVLAFIALFDDVKNGCPATSRQPGSLTAAHIDHTGHLKRVDALREALMVQHGFAEVKAAAE